MPCKDIASTCHHDNKRAINIDVLRVVFAVVIAVYHLHSITSYPSRGYLGVEFFFFVSGYFLIKNKTINQSSTELLFHMLKKLLPIILIVQMLTLCFELCYFDYNLQSGLHLFYCAIGDSFGLFLISPYSGFNITMWFVSAYFIGMMIMHLIIKKVGEEPAIVISLLIGVISLGFVMSKQGILNVWWGTDYKFYLLLRGVGDICLGIFSSFLVEKISTINLSFIGTICITITEVALTALIIVFMFSSVMGTDEFPIIIMIFVLVVLCFSQKGYPILSKKLNSYSTALATFSVLLFFSHTYWLRKMVAILPNATTGERIVAGYTLTALTIIITFVLVRMVLPKIKTSLIRILVSSEKNAD